jgi:hypothetical protein
MRLSTTPNQLRKIIEHGDEGQRRRLTASFNAARAVRQSHGKLTQKAAAAQFGVSVSTMRRYAGSILQKTKSGQFASPDNLPVLVQIPTVKGPQYKILSGRKQVNLVGAYRHAVKDYLSEGTERTRAKLQEFDAPVGVGRDRTPLLTDPQQLGKLYSIYGDELLDPGAGQYGYPEKKAA